jgi:hypothetical protein
MTIKQNERLLEKKALNKARKTTRFSGVEGELKNVRAKIKYV